MHTVVIPPVRVAALVLAAGLSRRMACPKLLLPLRGQALIAPVLAAATACHACGRPLFATVGGVLGPHSPEALRQLLVQVGVQIFVAEDAALGQAHSLRCGLEGMLRHWEQHGEAWPLDGLCVLLGDQPLLTPALLQSLLLAFAEHRQSFVAPEYKGQRGTPVIIPRASFGAVMQLDGDTGARPLLQEAGVSLHLVSVQEPSLLVDVDTCEAYAALVRML